MSAGRLMSALAVEHAISYAPPHVLFNTRIGSPGDHFVVSGRNFGPSVNADVAVMIGGVPCTGLNMLVPHEKIEAVVPDGRGTNLPVVV